MLLFLWPTETTENLLKNCLKVGISADFKTTGNISVELEPSKIEPKDDCKELTHKTTGMYLNFYT